MSLYRKKRFGGERWLADGPVVSTVTSQQEASCVWSSGCSSFLQHSKDMPVRLINDDDEREQTINRWIESLKCDKIPSLWDQSPLFPSLQCARETLVDFGILFQHGIVCVYFPNTWNQAHTESSPFLRTAFVWVLLTLRVLASSTGKVIRS